MPFNPYTWNTTQPSASQLISNGQVTILNNFSFLGDTTGNTTTGYLQLPSGLIMQWGKTGAIANGGPTTDLAVPLTFAGMGMQAFPTAIFSLQVTMISSAPSTKGPYSVDSVTVPTATGFTLRVSQAFPSGFYVFAIGN